MNADELNGLSFDLTVRKFVATFFFHCSQSDIEKRTSIFDTYHMHGPLSQRVKVKSNDMTMNNRVIYEIAIAEREATAE